MKRCLALAALLALACGTGAPRAAASPPPPPPSVAPEPSPSPHPLPSAPGSVFLIVMENQNFDQALKGPYTAELAAQYSLATNYHAVTHPSLPNYLALTSGSTWGIADDGYHRLPAGGLGAQLDQAGLSWKAYMEAMDRGCFNSGYPYALKHNPFAYYGGACPANVVPLNRLEADLAAGAPRFVWITPDLCHDTHDCPVQAGDDFLAGLIPGLLATPAWQNHGLLLITWDEAFSADNRVPAILVTPGVWKRQSDARYDHYSLLATVEDWLGLPRLALAGQASAMRDLVT